MLVSCRWILETLNFSIPPSETIDTLIAIGHEVDDVVDLGMLDNPIRIARILKVEPHPDAEVENLTVCTVDDGQGEPAVVVCGAPNVREGAIGVLARSGAKLPNGKTLRKTRIRGAASEGMLLALDEMGLGSDHSGIVILDDDAPVGEGYDMLLNMEITPNRADCFSIRGLARELAAANNRKVYSDRVRLRETFETIHDLTNVTIRCPEACPRYTARLIKNVKIGPSPEWLQRRLLACGLRPVNNVVDATNYLLLEYGHPMHAFDFDRLDGQRIVVRMAEAGEKIKIIDGSQIELRPGKDMVIADGAKPVALAGIMGGLDSEVGDATTNLLIESAYFDPPTIRRTSRHHHVSTDASYRFERGTDIHAVAEALEKVCELIVEIAGGEIPKGIADNMPHPPAPPQLLIRPERAAHVLGVNIPKLEMADLVAALGFEIVRSESEIMVLSVPSYRVDISREEDVFEEIARMYGYDRIEPTMPYLPATTRAPNRAVVLDRAVKNRMAALGFDEAIHLSFIGADYLEELDIEHGNALKVLNPLSRDQDTLRPMLAPSMIQTLLYNQNRGNTDLALFEVAATFHFGDMATPTVEKPALSIACMGPCRPGSWQGTAPDWDFYRLKGAIEALLAGLGIESLRLEEGGPDLLHAGRRARILAGNAEIGWFGELAPALRESLGFRARPQIAEISLAALGPLATADRRACDLPRFPAMERDLALVVDRDMAAGEVERVIRQAAADMLEDVFLFDCYLGEQVAAGKKSLAYRLVYRHPERTLTDEETDEMQAQVLKALKNEMGATLRD